MFFTELLWISRSPEKHQQGLNLLKNNLQNFFTTKELTYEWLSFYGHIPDIKKYLKNPQRAWKRPQGLQI